MQSKTGKPRRTRPPALTILAIWYFALAVYNLIGIFGILTHSEGLFAFAKALFATFDAGLWGDVLRVFVSLLYGVGALAVGLGLWAIKPWAWGAGLIMGVLLLPGIPVGTFIGAVTIVLLLRHTGIREAFRENA